MFLVIEMQHNGDQLSHIVNTYSTAQEAESKFHAVLSSAAISTVEEHSAVMLESNGSLLRTECYTHKEAEE